MVVTPFPGSHNRRSITFALAIVVAERVPEPPYSVLMDIIRAERGVPRAREGRRNTQPTTAVVTHPTKRAAGGRCMHEPFDLNDLSPMETRRVDVFFMRDRQKFVGKSEQHISWCLPPSPYCTRPGMSIPLESTKVFRGDIFQRIQISTTSQPKGGRTPMGEVSRSKECFFNSACIPLIARSCR